MNKQKMRKVLHEILKGQYFDLTQYQDKYYLSKDILEKIPELDKVSVYEAIDYACKNAYSSKKNNKFIDAFIEKVVS